MNMRGKALLKSFIYEGKSMFSIRRFSRTPIIFKLNIMTMLYTVITIRHWFLKVTSQQILYIDGVIYGELHFKKVILGKRNSR